MCGGSGACVAEEMLCFGGGLAEVAEGGGCVGGGGVVLGGWWELGGCAGASGRGMCMCSYVVVV